MLLCNLHPDFELGLLLLQMCRQESQTRTVSFARRHWRPQDSNTAAGKQLYLILVHT